MKTGIQKIDANDEGARILFTDNPNINPAKLIELIQSKPTDYKFNGTDTLHISKPMDEDNVVRASVITEVINALSLQEAA